MGAQNEAVPTKIKELAAGPPLLPRAARMAPWNVCQTCPAFLDCETHVPFVNGLYPASCSCRAVSLVIMRQDCSAYAEEPLRTVGLLEAAHQYSVQDMHGSARTPTLAPLRIPE